MGQVAAVIALATIGRESVKSIAVNVSNLVGLFSGANAFFPEAGEPDEQPSEGDPAQTRDGFTTALWRQSNEITTLDRRRMMMAAGFSHRMGTDGRPNKPSQAPAYSRD